MYESIKTNLDKVADISKKYCNQETCKCDIKADDSWLSSMMVMMPLTMAIASPFSAAEFTYVNNILMQHAQMLNEVARTMLYNCIRFPPDGNLRTCLIEWMNHFPECEPTSNHDPGIYICNHFAL
uniref:Uncharacterized protein n=1 Tax=Romanomermis culicivorax TaxID=13658 RepID=A0A915HLD2_ROMCU